MAFRKVVVLGGGPIGLMCAIEAAEQLKSKFRSSVTLVELRGDYSRMNVPLLKGPVLKHLKSLNMKVNGQQTTVAKHAGVETSAAGQISAIESSLYKKAQTVGVKVRQNYKATMIIGKDKRADGRWKSMVITIGKWDHAQRKLATPFQCEQLSCDLLVVAIGGSAIEESLYRETLDFEHSRLKAESYAIYGVYGKDDSGSKNLFKLAQAESTKFGNVIKLDSQDHRYLLVTLKDITPADFQALKGNMSELRQVMTTVGTSYNNRVLGPLDSAAKAVGAFEVKIKRAQHALSPKFPAMLIGDAAVTPHPETGAGLLTGFHGFEAFRDLLAALKSVHRSSEEAVDAFCSFEDSYEVYIAAKALEGTVVTIQHLVSMLENYEKNCDKAFQQMSTSGAKNAVTIAKRIVVLLQARFTGELNRAKLLGGLLLTDSKRVNSKISTMNDLSETLQAMGGGQGQLASNDSVKKLWADLDTTYSYLVRLIGPLSTLDTTMQSMEGQIKAAGGTVKSSFRATAS